MEKGYHLTLDAFGDRKLMADLNTVYGFLDHCPDLIGMTKIMPPYVFKFKPLPPRPPEDCGISGVVLIAESHIAIHTWPEKGYLTMDIYSCEEFDQEAALSFIAELFGLTEKVVNFIIRGIKNIEVSQKPGDFG